MVAIKLNQTNPELQKRKKKQTKKRTTQHFVIKEKAKLAATKRRARASNRIKPFGMTQKTKTHKEMKCSSLIFMGIGNWKENKSETRAVCYHTFLSKLQCTNKPLEQIGKQTKIPKF